MLANRTVGNTFWNEITESSNFVVFFFAEWSLSYVCLKDISARLSNEKFITVDLIVFDVDDILYDNLRTKLALPLSHGKGETFFFKEGKCVSSIINYEGELEKISVYLNMHY